MFIKTQGRRSRVSCKMFHSYSKKKITGNDVNIAKYQRNPNQYYNEVSPHTGQNGRCQTFYREPRMERVGRNEDPPALMLEHPLGRAIMETACVHAKSLQLCSTLFSPVGCKVPGFSVHGILQTSLLEWVAIPSSRGSSQPRDRTCISYLSYIGRWVLYY